MKFYSQEPAPSAYYGTKEHLKKTTLQMRQSTFVAQVVTVVQGVSPLTKTLRATAPLRFVKSLRVCTGADGEFMPSLPGMITHSSWQLKHLLKCETVGESVHISDLISFCLVFCNPLL